LIRMKSNIIGISYFDLLVNDLIKHLLHHQIHTVFHIRIANLVQEMLIAKKIESN
jgi:hypothetical protein